MAVSRNPGNRQSATEWLQLFGQLSWYDILLAIIPAVLALPVVANALFAVPLHYAVGAAGVAGMILLTDALFVHSPVDWPSE